MLAHAFFKSDLILPRPPPLLLQDSGVRPLPQDYERGRERYITAMVICGRALRVLGVRPRGKQRYVLARAFVRVLFDL